ncbi:MAG TPA: oxidative damage protection protein [Thermoanaerobaculia bacterium]|nr:oxidative damage protection protein [Thermoanaerobaculia bacterium]
MSRTVSCSRCRREAEALAKRPPLPSALADELLARVCAECWAEWEKNEVMVINELRLNFMDPRAAEVLHQKMREFFELGADGSS